MEDVTDTVFRHLVRLWSLRVSGDASRGPAVMFTEFTRVDAAFRAVDDRAAGRPINGRLQFTEDERPLIAQLWGTRPEEFLRAASALETVGFDGVDINMGCPVRKIRKARSGAALIDDPPLAAEIIHACREGGSLPVSVKTRIGVEHRRTEQWCAFLLDQRPDALTVHPRTATQMSDGWADWREMARVVLLRDELAPETVILGNGDVRSLSHARRLIEQTGIDGVMVGRGIFRDPWLFVRDVTPGLAAWAEVDWDTRLSMAAEHIERYTMRWGKTRNYEVLKKFYRNYVPVHHAAGRALLERLYATADARSALRLIERARVEDSSHPVTASSNGEPA